MRRSSIIILAVCVLLLVYLATVFVSVQSTSKPDFGPKDATAMLNQLGRAFNAASVDGVLSFAAPNATVAGRDLKEIHRLLHQAFTAMKNPLVRFDDVQYQRVNDTTVRLTFRPTVVDTGADGLGGGAPLFSQPMTFTVSRIRVTRLGGLLHTYEWKISDVRTTDLPEAARGM